MNFEDEELVLHHSPLHQYLEEVTVNDYGKYLVESTYKRETTQSNTESTSIQRKSLFDFFCLLNLKNDLYHPKYVDSGDAVHSCIALLDSSLLCEEDQKLLIDLCEEVKKLTASTAFPQKPDEDLTNKGVFYGVVVLLLSISCSMVILLIRWNNLFTYVFLALLLVCCVAGLISIARYTKMKNIPKRILNNVRMFTDLLNNYDRLIDKAIRQIKEVEIITHGYSQVKLLKSLLKQKGFQSRRKCLKLRLCLKEGLIDLFYQLRNDTQMILRNKMKNALFDYKEEYIAMMPLDAFHEVFSSSQEMDSGNTFTDVTPLDQLKAIVCLYRLQLSEYMYLMVVSLFTFQRDNTEKHINEFFLSLQNIVKKATNISKSLEEQISVSWKMVFHHQQQIEEEKSEKKYSKEANNDEIIHLAEIHMQAGLARIKDMKTILLERGKSNDLPVDVLNSVVNEFKLSLDNAKFCVEDIIEKITPRDSEINVLPVKHSEISDEKREDNIVFAEICTNIGDMLYEGESETVHRNDSNLLNIEDERDFLKESRESRKLMRELKTILSVKESPVGLVAFPLTKLTNDTKNNLSDTEYSCNEEVILKEMKKKTNHKSAFVYDPDNNEYDNDCVGNNLPPSQPLRLPFVGLPSNLPMMGMMEEATFGSSSSDEGEVLGDIL